MKTLLPVLSALALAGACSFPATAGAAEKTSPALEEVAAFPDHQVTGVTVSPKGRIFVNFPLWSRSHLMSVGEWTDGKLTPYPNDGWNQTEGDPRTRWVCVQSVVADANNHLWVLDPAAPMMKKIVPDGPKLVQIDLDTAQVVKTYPFGPDIAPERSYLNDVRIDLKHRHAYITESGVGALIVLDLDTGKARRVLETHASTKAEPSATLTVEGYKLIDPKTGRTPMLHADGIALDPSGAYLYWHALTGETMHRIKTAALRDASLSASGLEKLVERLARTPKPDGMLADKDGGIYLAAFELNGICRFDPATGKTTTVLTDERLKWPDTMAWGPDGALYVTTSQIHRMAKYHGGESKRSEPYRVYRVRMEE